MISEPTVSEQMDLEFWLPPHQFFDTVVGLKTGKGEGPLETLRHFATAHAVEHCSSQSVKMIPVSYQKEAGHQIEANHSIK